ncbi:TonB-dependent receptor plug domain-containing protein [Methylosoma difficile]
MAQGLTAAAADKNEALDMSVEDLLNVEVTSVSKKAQALNNAPAAVFVISGEDIKRSGATSIPDALRLAPGLDVARIDSNKWAVSSRGFNGRFANKLLVLIDGRSAYTRSFSGVYWENQDVMMEDVDRIEVIRGPGATLWGANAVNGVINIISKHSSQTQGGSLNVGGGSKELGFGSFRYGAKWGDDTTGRAYVKGFNRDQNTRLTGGGAGDDWDKVQGGFRIDSQLDKHNALTFQGDVYQSNASQTSTYKQLAAPYSFEQTGTIPSAGGNLLGRLQHTFSATSDYSLQVYYDTYTRNEIQYTDSRDTLDVDFQHRFGFLDWQQIVWGLNYRYGHDFIKGTTLANGSAIFDITPTSVNDQLFSGFIQDELTLVDNKLWLTLGSKFEHNDYSGFEGQPSARVMWAPYHQHRFWAGVSRSVRTPSRAEKAFDLLINVTPPQALPFPPFTSPPIVTQLQGNSGFKSEQVLTYEAGYRTSFNKNVSLDATLFYNEYKGLRFGEPSALDINGFPWQLPVIIRNSGRAETYGFEASTIWQMVEWWRWDLNYSWLRTHIHEGVPSSTAISPEHRISLRAAFSPRNDVDLDAWLRYVDKNFIVTESGSQNIDSYVTLDLRMAWRPYRQLELAVVGQNLVNSSHLEYVQEFQTTSTLIDRGFYGKVSWSF